MHKLIVVFALTAAVADARGGLLSKLTNKATKPVQRVLQACGVVTCAVVALAAGSATPFAPLMSPRSAESADLHAKYPSILEKYLGREVLFTAEGVGQRGTVSAIDGYELQIISAAGPAESGEEMWEEQTITFNQIEAALSWDYPVIGNFIVFTPDGNRRGLEMKMVIAPARVGLSNDGKLEVEGETTREITLGVVSATTDDGRYVIKPYHSASFAPDPHRYDGTAALDPRAHRSASSSPLIVKHSNNLSRDLYIVRQENILFGIERLLIEETEISGNFFAKIAQDDRQRDANAAALQAGQPMPYEDVTLPAVTIYHTEELHAASFRGELIYYYENDGSKYLAYAIGHRDAQVEVLLPGGRNTKLVATEQIRAASISTVDNTAALGNSISFSGSDAFPLRHSVQWQGHRLPGARGALWQKQTLHGAIAVVLDNGLLVAKVLIHPLDGIYTSYNLYLVHKDSVKHFGNHHHRNE